MKNRYPIYVISKGRPKCITARALKRLGVDFAIVIEPQDEEEYRRINSECTFIVTPFSNLGEGSIPVRNFVWDHSILGGHSRHWVLDDNIEDFNRLNRNEKFSVRCPSTFIASEDFSDRFCNVGVSGMNYYSFCKSTDPVPPFYLNTRIYSCILINNKIPFRWRGRFNEDTDICIRAMKAGWCTVLFNAFLCGKVTTMRMKGGNTEEVYGGTDDRKEFAESLQKQHPDIVKVVRKFNRWHHQVDYSVFRKNRLSLIPDKTIPCHVDNYGMILDAE